MVKGKSILITGGTGTFGKSFVQKLLKEHKPAKIIIYSRDEFKQYTMSLLFKEHASKLRFFIGDVRDKERLYRAFRGVDYVIHAAAMKQVPVCEYNPFEAVKTNINGAQNIIEAALDCGVNKVIALSTDKAVNPINLYGATKMTSDKLFIAANAYAGSQQTSFSIVRYGNVIGSRGSVVPFFKMLVDRGEESLPVTDLAMSRFWINIDEALAMVFKALKSKLRGGATYVNKIPSIRIVDLAKVMSPAGKFHIVGIREGEKLHEKMITEYDAQYTYEYDDSYIIYPAHYSWWNRAEVLAGGKKVKENFSYSSETNQNWLDYSSIKSLLKGLEIVYS